MWGGYKKEFHAFSFYPSIFNTTPSSDNAFSLSGKILLPNCKFLQALRYRLLA